MTVRIKTNYPGRDEELTVGHNHAAYDRPGDAVFINVTTLKDGYDSKFVTVSIEDAEAIVAELSTIIQEFHDNAPEEPTVRERLNALPYGSVVHFRADPATADFFKLKDGRWISTNAGSYVTSGTITGLTPEMIGDFEFDVLFEGKR
jgi:hypothetical protein